MCECKYIVDFYTTLMGISTKSRILQSYTNTSSSIVTTKDIIYKMAKYVTLDVSTVTIVWEL